MSSGSGPESQATGPGEAASLSLANISWHRFGPAVRTRNLLLSSSRSSALNVAGRRDGSALAGARPLGLWDEVGATAVRPRANGGNGQGPGRAAVAALCLLNAAPVGAWRCCRDATFIDPVCRDIAPGTATCYSIRKPHYGVGAIRPRGNPSPLSEEGGRWGVGASGGPETAAVAPGEQIGSSTGLAGDARQVETTLRLDGAWRTRRDIRQREGSCKRQHCDGEAGTTRDLGSAGCAVPPWRRSHVVWAASGCLRISELRDAVKLIYQVGRSPRL